MRCPLFGHRVEDHGRLCLLKGREGAGDERTGSHFAVYGEGDHVVIKGGDHRHQCPADAALARAILASWRPLPVAILQTPNFPSPISDELVTTTRQHSLPRQKPYFRVAAKFRASTVSSSVYAGSAAAPALIG